MENQGAPGGERADGSTSTIAPSARQPALIELVVMVDVVAESNGVLACRQLGNPYLYHAGMRWKHVARRRAQDTPLRLVRAASVGRVEPLFFLCLGTHRSAAFPKAHHYRRTQCGSGPAIILQLLLQNVLSKRELRSYHQPRAVTTAIQ